MSIQREIFIDNFLANIQHFWSEKHPELRFSQLIEWIFTQVKNELDVDDLFYVEDEKIMEVMNKLFLKY